jgi:hypothetical protein
VSLILEALKKLERERQAPERGFLVVAPTDWPGSRPRRAALVGAACSLLLAAGGWAAWAWLRPSQAPPASAQRTTPAASPATGPPHPAPPPPTPAPATFPLPASPPATAASPESSASPARPRLALQAISRRDGRPVAIIDDRLVHEGDHYDGVVILRIGDSEVELEVDGQRRVLRF